MSRFGLLGGVVLAAAMAIAEPATAQTVTNYEGMGLGDGGPGTNATRVQVRSINFDAAGNMYLVDASQFRIRRVDSASDVIATVFGTGPRIASGSGVNSLAFRFKGADVGAGVLTAQAAQ